MSNSASSNQGSSFEELGVNEVCQDIAALPKDLGDSNFDRQSLTTLVNRALALFDDINSTNFKQSVSTCQTRPGDVVTALACSMFGIHKLFGHKPRPTQVAAVLMFLTKPANKGRILEMKTGEGKSDAIAMTAASHVLLTGKMVNIVTSNEVLAERDAEKYKRYFEEFGISVSDNIKFYSVHVQSNYATRNIYRECQVIYGLASSFSGDILQDILSGKDIAVCEKSLLIVDEVDSMLVDSRSFMTKIAQAPKGLSDLQQMRQLLWQIVIMAKVSPKHDSDVTKEHLFAAIRNQMLEALKNPSLRIKPYYKELGQRLLDSWIESALAAINDRKLDQDYVIENQEIVIVDRSTGVRLERTRWSNGLHEFLEMKHGLPVKADSFTSVFYSNLRFYTDFEGGLCGLTGTVGSEHPCAFLMEVYNLNIFKMPTFRRSRRKTLPPQFATSQANVNKNIISMILSTIDDGRPVLVIVETIQAVKDLEVALRVKWSGIGRMPRGAKIIQYTNSETDTELPDVTASTVILATNLAGRGTDIEVSQKLDEKSVLRVILGYFPDSLRIQEQAFGRTARKGQRGDCVMIALIPECSADIMMAAMIALIPECQNVSADIMMADLNDYYRDQREKHTWSGRICKFLRRRPSMTCSSRLSRS